MEVRLQEEREKCSKKIDEISKEYEEWLLSEQSEFDDMS